jgi:opacity protein-like surface antigen
MHRANRLLAGIIGWVAAMSAWGVEGDGLTPNPEFSWARWQGRASLGSTLPPWQASLSRIDNAGLKVDSVSLVGDYYFSRALIGHGSSGGFRTTGGLFHGPRAHMVQLYAVRSAIGNRGGALAVDRLALAGSEGPGVDVDSATLPYLGLGYTGLSVKGHWSFNADLGMTALSPGQTVKFGKVVGGTQSLDDLLRDMRLAPMLQLGVSYSF